MSLSFGNSTAGHGSMARRFASRRFALYALLVVLFAGPVALGAIPIAHANVPLNPNNVPTSSGSGTQYPVQDKVFYANGYWWVFWGSGGGTNGIYYESSPDGVTWSAPTTFTNPLLSGVSINSGTTTAGTTNTVLHDTSAAWTVNEWVGGNLHYTSGPAAGLSQAITSNTANTITTAAFAPAPSAAGNTFTINLNPNGGQGFDSYLVGNTLYYVVAPKTTANVNTNFWWGVATLQATGTVAYTQLDAVHNLPAARIGAAAMRATITVDGNGYPTMAVASSNAGSTIWYIDVFQCQGTIATCASTPATTAPTWYSTEYTLQTGNVADLTIPKLAPLTNAGTNYDALAFDDASSAAGAPGFGPFRVFIGASSAGSLGLPAAATCSPAGQFYNMVDYGLASQNNIVYVADAYFGGATYAFDCPVGGPVSAESAVSASSFILSFGFSGSTLVAAYAPCSSNAIAGCLSATISTMTSVNCCSALTTWAAGPNVAQNTEVNGAGSAIADNGEVDITPLSYATTALACPPQNCMGVAWMDGNVVKFATLSFTNFPVTVTIELREHQTPQTGWYPLNPLNEFSISYSGCAAVGCIAGLVPPVLYGSCTSVIGSCTTATPAYGDNGGASDGAYIIITNVMSYSAVTIAAKSTASGANEEWCLNIAGSNGLGACGATTVGSSDGIPAFVTVGGVQTANYLWFGYYDLLANPSKYTVQPALPAPTSVPVIHVITGPPTSAATFSTVAANDNQNAATATYWIERNSTDFASASIAGTASDQWAANPANLAWTVTSANQINPNIIYYHQYLNIFAINAGGVQNFDGTGGFVILGTLYGQPSTALATYTPAAGSTYSADLWSDAAQTVTFPAQATGTPTGTRWESATGSTYTTPAINSGVGVFPSGYSDTYWKQFEESIAYSTSDGSTPLTIPSITYTQFGSVTVTPLTLSTSNIWMDAGTPATVPQSIAGGSGERWNTQVFSWTITATNVVTNPSIEYYHQFSQLLDYATSDAAIPTTIPAMTYTSFGSTGAHPLTKVPTLTWLDANTQAMVPATIAGGAGEQWSTATSAWTVSATNIVDNPVFYTHQYQISFAVSPVGDGVTNPSGSNIWETAGQALAISATGQPNWLFVDWTSSTPGITFGSATAQLTTANLNGPGTITANFQISTGLAFQESGIALDGTHIWSVTLTSWPAAYVGSDIISGTTQTLLISGAPLGSYTYTVPSPQAWGAGTQYVVTSGGAGTSVLTVSNPSTVDDVSFEGQFWLQLSVNPIGSGTATANGGGSQWFSAGTPVTLVAAPIGASAFQQWSGFACNPACSAATNNIVINGPVSAQANFFVPLSISVCLPETAGVGTQVVCTVTITGGSGFITLTNSGLPAGVTLSYSPNGNPGLPASASPPATSTMTVTIAANAPYGTYTWTVTATDSDSLQGSTTYQLNIISPSVTTIGFTTSAYAITYGSQNALFSADGYWFVVYSDGSNLIYRASTDSSGNSWGAASEIIAGINQGYSFAVASSGSDVYLVLLSPSFTGGFYYIHGVVQVVSMAASINWDTCSGSCGLAPVAMSKLSVAPGLTTAGSPNVYVDTSSYCATASPSGVCVWVTAPALDSNLMWHVEVAQLTNTWRIPAAIGTLGDVQLHQVYTGTTSQVHAELYQMPDAVAATFAVGNTPQLPFVTVFDHPYLSAMTFCVGGVTIAGACPAPPASWANIKIYMQQAQGVVMPAALGTDVIFFAGLASYGAPGADVQFYSFNYNSVTPALSTFSAPAALGITTIPANAVVNHSWHISMTFGGASLYLAYGVDDNLAFQVGTIGMGPSYPVSWSIPVQVPGVSGLVGGVTISYSGNTVGMTWVQTSGDRYAVKFAVI